MTLRLEPDDPDAALQRLIADYQRVVTESLEFMGQLVAENARLRADLARLTTLEQER